MSRKAIKFTLVATTALSWAVPAFAQEAAQSSKDVSDIIVTARRIEERLQDVPISITVVNQQTLSDRNISNAADLGTYTPSLSTNSRFGPEKASFAIRGFTQEIRTEPSVGVYFADVVAPRASGTNPSGNGSGVGSMFDLQNVQVLKGPQGTLFGRNTTGGAILLVPQKPTGKLEGYVEGSLGNYDMRRLQAVLNIPASDTFRIRAGVDWQKRDGYLKNKSGIGARDFANVDYIAARLSVVGDLTPNLENYTVASFTYSDTNGGALKALACNRVAAANPNPAVSTNPGRSCVHIDRQNARGDGFWDVENNNPDPYQKTRQWQVINTTTWRATDNLTIKNIISYAEFREASSLSVFGDNFFTPAGATLPIGGLFYTRNGFHAANQSTFTEELQFQGSLVDGRLNWQAGAYLEVSKPLGVTSTYAQLSLPCTDVQTLQCTDVLGMAAGRFIGALNNQNITDSFNNKGFYAQATYDLTDKLSVTGGIRYTIDVAREAVEYLSIKFPAPNTPLLTCHNLVRFDSNPSPTVFAPVVVTDKSQCHLDFKTESEKPTWLIDLEYKPIDDMMVYAKWARGYRAGAINTVNQGLETWRPEKVDTYEAGLKTSFRGAVSGNLNIAAFYNDFRDQQLSAILLPAVTGLGGAAVIINAGKSRMWGVEVESSISPLEGLRFDIGYAYLNTRLLSFNPPPTPSVFQPPRPNALVGDDLAFSPRNRVTLTGSYTLPLGEDIGKITFGATYVHTDKYNSQQRGISPLATSKASDLINLNASWKSMLGSPLDLSFFMTNVTNEKNWTVSAGGYGFIGLDTAVLAPPRMWGFRLRYNFGA